MREGPSAAVLAAFGISGVPHRLGNGAGAVFRTGGHVLKRGDNAREVAWCAATLSGLPQGEFRVAAYRQSASGSWLVEGWFAQGHLHGDHRTDRWPDVLRTCRAFHRALSGLDRPAFLAERTHLWAVADRIAWGEQPLACHPDLTELVGSLVRALRPVTLPDQVVHGDFTGNVLFANGFAPAVIDFTPYWRPAAFAEAIVAVDALVWHRASPSILDQVANIPEGRQMLLRAEIRRLMEIDGRARRDGTAVLREIEAHKPVVELLSAIRS